MLRCVILLIAFQAVSAIAAETRITVYTNRPAELTVDGTHRKGFKDTHSLVWNHLPDDVYVEPTITATDESGRTGTAKGYAVAGTSSEVCIEIPDFVKVVVPPDPETSCPQTCSHGSCWDDACDFWWLFFWGMIGIPLFAAAIYSYWKWRCCKLAERELRFREQQYEGSKLRSSGSGTNVS